MKKLLWTLTLASAMAADWGPPVDVTHELKPVVTYRAKVEGDVLVVQATVQPGWHTFSMDNEKRAAEKLAGKKSIGIDQPTVIKLDGVEVAGPWHQSKVKDFSKPALRWYSWGFEEQAIFAAKVKASADAKLSIRGQACSDTTCKNIDVAVTAKTSPRATPFDLKALEVCR